MTLNLVVEPCHEFQVEQLVSGMDRPGIHSVQGGMTVRRVIAYELLILLVLAWLLAQGLQSTLPSWITPHGLWYYSVIAGGFGGLLYVLRAVYLSACVRKDWDNAWRLWYYLRPLTSMLAGGACCLFLKAGLLVLEADKGAESIDFGFYALAFVAGLNVDNFVRKIEEIAASTWGIRKSRAAQSSATDQNGRNGQE